MTSAECIIMSAAIRSSKIKNSKELARRSGTPASSMRYKLLHPEMIRLSDLAAWQPFCKFTADELVALFRSV